MSEPIRLETQLLHYEDGVWNPYSYLWDDANRDAILVDATGTNRPLQVGDTAATNSKRERTWHVNATNECKLVPQRRPKVRARICGEPIGSLGAAAIRAVVHRLPSALTTRSGHPRCDPHDAKSHRSNDRARSYLHVNCGMCHHPGGNAIVSFFLRRDLPFDKLNTNKGTGIGTFGIHDAKIIAPGDPYRSLLLYRMSKLGYARMPYIGSQVADSEAVTLIAEWIRSLASDPAAPVSSPLTSGNSDWTSLEQAAAISISHEQRDSAIAHAT